MTGKRLNAAVEQFCREKRVLAWLLSHKELPAGFADAALNHQVITQLKVLDCMAHGVQAGGTARSR